MTQHKKNDGSLLQSRESSNQNPEEQADNIRELLNLVTQETRYVLIQNIVAHPKEMPSLKELAYANPSKSKSTIRNHLDKLIEADVVEAVHLPKEERSRDLPHRFFRLTGAGRGFLENHDLLKAEETLKEMHSMLEKTDEIQKYAEAPRPSIPENNDDEEMSGNSCRKVKP
jgi:DNA-binding transcriptional ArsR family regulator